MLLLKFSMQKCFVCLFVGGYFCESGNFHPISTASHVEDKAVWDNTYIQHFLWPRLV